MPSANHALIASTTHAGDGSEVPAEQYLTFTLADEQYGVDILRVQEIKGWTPVPRIPRAPAFLCGVINLRGDVVPIIDLRRRFNLERADYTPTTVVVVVLVRHADAATRLGVVVDGVSDVIDVRHEAIRAAPDFGTVVETDFIHGLVEAGGEMVMLLDIDRLLGLSELRSLERLADAPHGCATHGRRDE